MTRFTDDNTEGYSAADLEIINEMFADACAEAGFDPDDFDLTDIQEQLIKHFSERVLAEYDSREG